MNQEQIKTENNASCPVEVCRIVPGQKPETVTDAVVAEQAVTVMIDTVGSFTIMATPCDIEALAVGFVYSEGIINGIEDCLSVSKNETLSNVVGIVVQDPTQIAKRNLIVASSCGMCGVRNIEKMLAQMSPCRNTLSVSPDHLIAMTEKLRSQQQLFQATGGAHAAGIFDAAGEIIAFAEDIGRHSAFDKAIGKCLMSKQKMHGCGVVLSGRVSLEMVTKAARAGIELIAAVSAPSSYAVEAAQKWNITLCGFVRPRRMNVYSDYGRIKR
jgi:FdhD protein